MKILLTAAFTLAMTTSSTALASSTVSVKDVASPTSIGNPIKEFLCEWVCPNHPACN